MLKRLLVTLLPFLASSCGDGAKPSGDVQTIDPKDILFSLPTLCDPAPALDSLPAPAGARSLHEDDWRQIEFVPANDDEYISSQLVALATFKKEHQKGKSGWTSVYVRKEHPSPLASIGLRDTALPALPTSAVSVNGHAVHGGFALSDGDWFIYGQRSSGGSIIQLGISPHSSHCPERFASALTQITRDSRVLIVDWYAGVIVDATSVESILTWAGCYQRP